MNYFKKLKQVICYAFMQSSLICKLMIIKFFYIVFHGFGQTEIAYDGLFLGSSKFTQLPRMPLSNDARFKSDQN